MAYEDRNPVWLVGGEEADFYLTETQNKTATRAGVLSEAKGPSTVQAPDLPLPPGQVLFDNRTPEDVGASPHLRSAAGAE